VGASLDCGLGCTSALSVTHSVDAVAVCGRGAILFIYLFIYFIMESYSQYIQRRRQQQQRQLLLLL